MLLTSPQARSGRERLAQMLALALVAATVWTGRGRGQEAPKGEREGGAAAAEPKARQVPETLNFANGLFRARRYELAAEEYERFLKDAKSGPDAVDAWYGLANARLFQRQNEPARQAFAQFLKLAPNHPSARTAWYRVGETSYMLGDLATARRALETFVAGPQGHRNLETAWPYLGEVCLRMRDLPRARQAYEQALGAYPEGSLADRARFGLGKTLAAQGEADEAKRVLTDLAKREGEWTDRAWFQIAQIDAGAGRFAVAAEDYAALERVAPKSPLLGEARLNRAEALIKLGQREPAEALLRGLIADAPHNLAAQAAFALGSSQLERGAEAEALATLDDARKRFPKTSMTTALLFQSAEAAQKLGRGDEARARFLKAAEIDPKDPLADDALIRAARGALEARDHDDARNLASTFSTRFPDSPLRADARLIEARVAMVEGRPKDAIAILTKSLAEDKPVPRTAEAERYYLGLAYRADGQPAKADEILDALAKTPAAPAATNAQYLVGQGHFEAKRYAESIPALETYLAGRPEGEVAANALTYVVWARLELGQVDEASKALHRLADRFPKSEQARLATIARARLLVQSGNAAEAAGVYERYLTDNSDSKKAPKGAEPDVLLGEWGWALVDAGKTAEADRVFARLLEEHPDSPHAADARVNLAETAYQAKKYDEVLKLLAPLIADEAKTSARLAPPALYLAARAQDKRNDGAAAAKTLDRLIADYPDHRYRREARFLRAEVALKDGDAETAEAGFAALAAEPPAETDPPRFGEAVRLGRIQGLLALKRWKDVLDASDEFKTRAPKDSTIAEVDYARGRALQALARFDDARAAYKAVIEARKGGDLAARAQLMRGETYFHQKDYQNALREFFMVDTLYDAATWQAAALLEAGKVYERLDRWGLAAETYEGLRSKFPSDPSAAEAKTRLEAARRQAQAPAGSKTR